MKYTMGVQIFLLYGGWEIEASAVERLCKAKYWTKIDCKITRNICVLFAKLRQGGRGVRQFSGCLRETKYEQILFRTVP